MLLCTPCEVRKKQMQLTVYAVCVQRTTICLYTLNPPYQTCCRAIRDALGGGRRSCSDAAGAQRQQVHGCQPEPLTPIQNPCRATRDAVGGWTAHLLLALLAPSAGMFVAASQNP